jgi:hypothetical protein
MSDEGLEAPGSELEVMLLKDKKDVIGLDPADVMLRMRARMSSRAGG